MFGIAFGLLVSAAQAGTLEVALAGKTGVLLTPSSLEVGLTFKGVEEATTPWENIESSALSILCSDAGAPPVDDFVEQLTLKVNEDKWALAPGSNVKFSCGEGKMLTITDIHGTKIGAWKSGVGMTVEKAKSRAAR